MPGARVPVRKIREILRLKFELKRSNREIGLACRVSAGTVWDTLCRWKASSLEWPLPDHLSDEALEERLYRDRSSSRTARPTPDWAEVHGELRKPHVTLALLWQEYRDLLERELRGAPTDQLVLKRTGHSAQAQAVEPLDRPVKHVRVPPLRASVVVARATDVLVQSGSREFERRSPAGQACSAP